MKTNNAYSALANYYDRLMTDYNYNSMIEFILSKINKGKGLDLACGSGTITIALAKCGYSMSGTDVETNMLSVARDKAIAEGLKINFLCKDMLELELERKYNFITATCDVMNYVPSEQELDILLNTLYLGLENQGILIFDISSKYKLTEILGDNLFYEDYEDMTYMWQNELDIDSHCVDMNITIFAKVGDNYIRSDEEHTQYYYELQRILDSINSAGFDKVEVLDGVTYKEVSADSNRQLFVCYKL